MPKRPKGYTIWNKECSTYIKAWCMVGIPVQTIAERLKFMGYKGHSRKQLFLYYKKELSYSHEIALDNIKAKAFALALNGDKTMICFVLKCQGGWKEGINHNIDLGQKPVINLVFQNDETVTRNALPDDEP